MADDWIKMRKELPEDPAVFLLAQRVGIDEHTVLGKLLVLWSWADSHTDDGFVPDITGEIVDRLVRCEGFAAGLVSVGWLRLSDPTGVEFLNYDRHMSRNAKARAVDARRRHGKISDESRTERGQNADESRKIFGQKRSIEKRREEKRREGVVTTQIVWPAALDTVEVRAAMDSWLEYKKAIRDSYKTVDSINRLIAKFDKPGLGARVFIDCVNDSIANNWKGLHTDKYVAGGKQASAPQPDNSFAKRLAAKLDAEAEQRYRERVAAEGGVDVGKD